MLTSRHLSLAGRLPLAAAFLFPRSFPFSGAFRKLAAGVSPPVAGFGSASLLLVTSVTAFSDLGADTQLLEGLGPNCRRIGRQILMKEAA